MKTQILTLVFSIFTSITFAQQSTAIILPHNEEGFVRLMVTDHQNEQVIVMFKKGDRLIKKDVINAKDYEKGFVKLYDIRNLKSGNYKIEIYNQDTLHSYDFTTNTSESVSTQFWKEQLNNNTRYAAGKRTDSLALITGN